MQMRQIKTLLMEMPFLGTSLRAQSERRILSRGWFVYRDNHVVFPKNCEIIRMIFSNKGHYERSLVKLLKNVTKPETCVYDVGGNIGIISLELLNDKPDIQLRTFEPSPNNLPYLLKNRQNSRFLNNWEVIGKAVCSEVGEVCFHVSPESKGAMDGIRPTRRVPDQKPLVQKVPATTIDTDWKEVGKPCVSLIKVDVEGAEKAVLEGAVNCIDECRPIVVLEWNAINLLAYDVEVDFILRFASQHSYFVVAIPQMACFASSLHLVAAMSYTENFALIPK